MRCEHLRQLGMSPAIADLEFASKNIDGRGSGNDSDNEDGLVIASPDDDMVEQGSPFDEMDSILNRAASSDEEADDHLPAVQESMEIPYRKFGQEIILSERSAHTPPSRWMLVNETIANRWPDPDQARNCSSAPPSAVSPMKEEIKEEQSTTAMIALLAPLPVAIVLTAPSTSFIGQHQQSQQNFATVQPPTPIYPYLSKEESMKCNQCDRSFRKASELTLHQYTHDIEKHHARNRMFQCPECRIPLRTKALLAKHLEASHGSHIDDSVTASIDPCASTQSVLGGSAPIASNPRSFVCSDCNIGFRKHGILAKHLRSKTHVMKLETLKKLPEDSLSLITKRDNGACLNGVDTTDCEKARKSLFEIVEMIRAENQRASTQAAPGSSTGAPKAAAQTTSGSEGLEEQLSISPASANGGAETLCNGQRSNNEEISSLQRSQSSDIALSTTVVDSSNSPKSRSDPTVRESSNASRREETSNIKCVSANVWIPPRADVPVSVSALLTAIGHYYAARNDACNIRAVQEVVAELREETEAIRALSSPVQMVCIVEMLILVYDIPFPCFPAVTMKNLKEFVLKEPSTCSSPVVRILNSNGFAASPLMPQGTKCQICGVNADSPLELQVHLYSDHISIRDGKDLKCPKRHCDKVYPNKDSLRHHIIAHYQQRVDATPGDSDNLAEAREDDSVSSATSVLASRLADDVVDQRGSPMSDASEVSWPSPASSYACPVRYAISPSVMPCLYNSIGSVMFLHEFMFVRFSRKLAVAVLMCDLTIQMTVLIIF
uniref:C2H2-type domain-containing protein n=1 Tax=Angiostrongylus cantonensis TaxID=6313 RepID=A0A158PBX4_ANGCA